MKIALFSDIHGKILLPFKLVDLYQKQTGTKIDYILQCGDMGAYPKLETLDKATIKHASLDRDELGFHDNFTKADASIKSFLDTLNIPMICVRGNHEDHSFLDQLEMKDPQESLFSIDVYGKVFVCKSGRPQILKTANEELSFVGIGRIGDRKQRHEKRFIQDYERKEIKKLFSSKAHFDLLISHDKDDGSQRGYGMAEIRELLDKVIFLYHFYGHTGEPYNRQTDTNGITEAIKIKELEFNKSGILEQGCMILLTKENGQIHLEVVDQKFTNQLTKSSWKMM